VRDLQDSVGTGYEVEMTANLTDSWRMTFNLGLPKTWNQNAYQDSKVYMAQNFAVLSKIAVAAGAANLDPVLPTPGASATVGTATVDPTTPTALLSSAQNVVNQWNSLMRAAQNNFVDGIRSPNDQNPYSVNVFTDFTFRKGALKGFSAGIGEQYRGRFIIGNRAGDTIVNPANPLTAIHDPSVSVYTPIYARPWRPVTATLGYNWKYRDKIPVTFRLRVSNLLNDQHPQYFNATQRPRNNDYTSPARITVPADFALPNPISFYLSTEVKL
jgi:hypothetical protein